MRVITVAALCGLVAMATPAIAQDSPQPTTNPAPVKEKKTCRYYTQTGSIMPGKRTCHTAKEWQDLDAQSRANMERMNGGNRNGWGGDTRTGG